MKSAACLVLRNQLINRLVETRSNLLGDGLIMSELSTFLFAVPSFSEGMGRVLDVGDTLTEYNRSETTEQADQRALQADWCAVGLDIFSAVNGFKSVATQKIAAEKP